MEASIVDLNQISNDLNSEITKICRKIKFLNGLKELETFVNSKVWKNIHGKPKSHDFIYDKMNKIFGVNNSSIYDNGSTIKGPDFLSNLSLEDVNLIDEIDRNHKPGFHEIGDFYILYIGSVVVMKKPTYQ